MKTITALLAILLCFCLLSPVSAQEEENGNLFYMVMIKIKPGKVGKFLELFEKTNTAKDNEFLISEKVFTHRTGPEWSILLMREYKDFAAVQKAFEREDELDKEKFPDEKEREKIFDELNEYRISHTDAIVIENPKLGK